MKTRAKVGKGGASVVRRQKVVKQVGIPAQSAAQPAADRPEEGTSQCDVGVECEDPEEDQEVEKPHQRQEVTTQQSELVQGEPEAAEDAPTHPEDLTPYVATCAEHLENLRKRKRDQEERVGELLQESLANVEDVVRFLMTSLHQVHAEARAEFDASDAKLTASLTIHNRIEKKMKMIAAILMHEQSEEVQND